MEQIYTPKHDYKVLCFCITYNQAKYIEDTLNGFAMQKTNFPFACLVVEDCSTDGEQEVIKSWLNENCDMQKAEYIDLELSNVILVPHKSNKNCTFAIYLLKRNLWKEPKLKEELVKPWREHCEYEALCEGDDYWIESKKLQKQVEYLDTHSDIVISCHRYKVLTQSDGGIEAFKHPYFDSKEHRNEDTMVFNLKYNYSAWWCTKTPTVLFRACLFEPDFTWKFQYGRDVHTYFNLLTKGNGVCHSFEGTVYRLNDTSTYGRYSLTQKREIDYMVYKEFYEMTKNPTILNCFKRIRFIRSKCSCLILIKEKIVSLFLLLRNGGLKNIPPMNNEKYL